MCTCIARTIWRPIEPILLGISVVFLVLVNFVGVPFIQNSNLCLFSITAGADWPSLPLNLHVDLVSAGITFGVFGYCTTLGTTSSCTREWIVDFRSLPGNIQFLKDATNSVSRGLSGCILLHPFALVVTVAALIFIRSRFRFIFVILAAISTFVAVVIDARLILLLQNHLSASADAQVQFGTSYGHLIVATVILLITMTISLLVCDCLVHTAGRNLTAPHSKKGWMRADGQ
ncbi:hypothetical protein BD410DRAFT_535812 [Rickenella mellea]|uniref:Pali-domain-containing protein n=1 Tax=Rickenella mellea TaxID=50990 RepID=A0A4Y7PR11_9AGAM|nr:hypothetical protein BD410DRAFT_535812 [Rickenella mellea]